MNETTYHVNSTHKVKAGEYTASTYSRDSNYFSPTGKFRFVKDGKVWVVSHVDYDAESAERTYHRLLPTLRAAKDYAEQIVRDLPANRVSRAEAIRRNMPVS